MKHIKKNNSTAKIASFFIIALAIAAFLIAYHLTKPIQYPENIKPISSMADVDFKELLKDSPGQQALIFFDIDDTLTSTNDVAGRSDYSLLFQLHSFLRHPQLVQPKTLAYYLSILWKEVARRVLEPMSVPLVKNLEEQGHVVLALTDVSSGSYGVIKNFPAWRDSVLRNFDFVFSQKFPNTVFCSLPARNNNYPCIYNGIVCCNSEPKGNVVEALLKHFSYYKPNLIILFDDRIKNVISVQRTCQKLNIPFKGFHYLAKLNLPGTWNEQRARLQFKYLLQHDHWISDPEADDMMLNKQVNNPCPAVKTP